MPIFFWVSIIVFVADLVFRRAILIDFPLDIECLIMTPVTCKHTPSQKVNILFRNEDDTIKVARTHEHIVILSQLKKSNPSLRLTLEVSFSENSKGL